MKLILIIILLLSISSSGFCEPKVESVFSKIADLILKRDLAQAVNVIDQYSLLTETEIEKFKEPEKKLEEENLRMELLKYIARVYFSYYKRRAFDNLTLDHMRAGLGLSDNSEYFAKKRGLWSVSTTDDLADQMQTLMSDLYPLRHLLKSINLKILLSKSLNELLESKEYQQSPLYKVALIFHQEDLHTEVKSRLQAGIANLDEYTKQSIYAALRFRDELIMRDPEQNAKLIHNESKCANLRNENEFAKISQDGNLLLLYCKINLSSYPYAVLYINATNSSVFSPIHTDNNITSDQAIFNFIPYSQKFIYSYRPNPSLNHDRAIKIETLGTIKEETITLEKHYIHKAYLSNHPNNKWLAVAWQPFGDTKLRWQLRNLTNNIEFTLDTVDKTFHAAAFSPDGRYFVIVSTDVVSVYDLEVASQKYNLGPAVDYVNAANEIILRSSFMNDQKLSDVSVKFSSDNKFLAIGSSNGPHFKVWNIQQLPEPIFEKSIGYHFQFTTSGNYFCVFDYASRDKFVTARLYEIKDNKVKYLESKTFRLPLPLLTPIHSETNGNFIITYGNEQKSVNIYDISSGKFKLIATIQSSKENDLHTIKGVSSSYNGERITLQTLYDLNIWEIDRNRKFNLNYSLLDLSEEILDPKTLPDGIGTKLRSSK